jgi:hypothetical protein
MVSPVVSCEASYHFVSDIHQLLPSCAVRCALDGHADERHPLALDVLPHRISQSVGFYIPLRPGTAIGCGI